MIRSGNPALNASVFQGARAYAGAKVMSIEGTVNKASFLLLLVIFVASLAWSNPERFMPFIFPAVIAGFIVAMITVFKPQWAPLTSPIYAALQGLFLGTISSMMEMTYPGIVIQAVALTFGTLFCMLIAYKTKLIRVSEKFRLGVFAATGSIALIYFVSMIMGFFGASIPFIHESGPIGIGFSLFVVVIAALNLVMDFDFIERGAQAGISKHMEWYGAFALIVTLVWLYIEILRLLSKTRRR